MNAHAIAKTQTQRKMTMELFIIWAACAILCAFIAQSKGHNPGAWAAIGALGGIFAVIAIAAIPAKADGGE
jgi:membrane associated rhomboid family serine protease